MSSSNFKAVVTARLAILKMAKIVYALQWPVVEGPIYWVVFWTDWCFSRALLFALHSLSFTEQILLFESYANQGVWVLRNKDHRSVMRKESFVALSSWLIMCVNL